MSEARVTAHESFAVRSSAAIKDGVCRVGLSVSEMEDLARAGGRAEKCSTRELSLILAKHQHGLRTATSAPQWGATTVASTMKLAHMAGIATFVTGGIGGVHRHGELSMDISADLTELSRTPVIVVSAGIKSILDIRRTLEVLETYGVPAIAYQTDEFPAFFSPHSGVAAPARADNASQIASTYIIAQELGLLHGMLVAVPNDDPAGANVEEAIQAALNDAEAQGVSGRDVTPFILKLVAEKTAGDSLRSNMALVERNAAVGADIAVAIANQRRGQMRAVASSTRTHHAASPLPWPRVIVMGGAVLDVVAKPVKDQKLTLSTSNPATCTESDGGVARNIAEVLGRLGSSPLLYSAVGNDSRGLSMVERLAEECGVHSSRQTIQVVDGANTATYIAILNELGDLHTACADMTVLNHIRPPPQLLLERAEFLVMDANPPVDVMRQAALDAVRAGVKLFWEPTSVPKALTAANDKIFLSCLSYASPNLDELSAMADGWSCTPYDLDVLLYDDELESVRPLAANVLERMSSAGAHLLVTCGPKGVLLASKGASAADVTFQRFISPQGISMKNATGAGDTLAGAFIHSLLNGNTISEAVSIGIEAAAISLQCEEKTISPLLSDSVLRRKD